MKILLLAPSVTPGSGGVADYALRLAAFLAGEGTACRAVGIDAFTPALVEEFQPDWVSLQFVAYAFDRRGLAWNLGARLRRIAPRARWHVLFHEIWIGARRGAPLRQRLLGLAQRAALRRAMRDLRPDATDTSNPTYQALLRRAGIDAGLMPLFGNIPLAVPDAAGAAALDALLAARGLAPADPGQLRVGLFGALHPVWPPEPFFTHLRGAGRPPVVISVGRLGPGRALWERLRRDPGAITFVELGEQPPALISLLLQRLDCGLATTPWQVIGKSGSVAAMLEHGLPVLVNRVEPYNLPGLPTDEAPAADPLLLPATDALPPLPPRRAPVSLLPGVGRQFLRSLAAARPLRVVIVSPSFGTYGGIEAFVLALAKSLHADPGLRVRVVWKKARGFQSTALLEERCRESGVETFTVGKAGAGLWRQIGWADVVHLQNAPPDAVAFARLRGKPLALTIHNYFRAGIGHGRLWKRAARLADARWYNSNFVWKTWEGDHPLPGSRRVPTVSELPTGVLPASRRRGFVFIARWIPNKGLEVLLEAYARAALPPDVWPLRLMGDGPLRPEVEARIAWEPGRFAGVELLGFVSEERKAAVLRGAKWLVVPPHTNEDMGITPLEARSVGVPVIATRDGGLPEAAGDDALLCAPGDADALAARLREAAAMGEAEYEDRSRRARESLSDFLVPWSFYPQAYRALAGKGTS